MKLRFCVICGTNKDLQHHHITPKAEGGDDHQWNMLTLCYDHHNFIHNIRRTRKEGHFNSLCEMTKTNVNKGGRPKLPEEKADLVIELRKKGLSYRKIQAQTGHGVATIRRVLKDYDEIGSYVELYSNGCPD